MIKEVTMYSASCDNCGDTWEHWHHGWSAVPDEQQMEEELGDHDWHTDEEGKHYCPLCFKIDDNDVFILNRERTAPPPPKS